MEDGITTLDMTLDLASVAAAVYVSVLSLKIPVALAPIERVGPAFPAFFLRLTVELPVIEFDVTLHVS